MTRPHSPSSASARLRRRPTLAIESLETRRLLAATTLASTVASGLPYAFFIDGSGTVSYQSDRLTNDPLNPTTPTGQIELPGLKAQSIAAYTGADGEPTVVALNGPESFVYANHYAPTGHDAQPLAWTGWQPLGSFVGTSISAATNAVGGPAIFAIGVDHAVYEDQETLPATPTTPAVLTGFDPIGGLYATAVKAQADGSGFAVFALDGPETNVFEADTLYSGNPGSDGALQASTWQSVEGLVATQIDVSRGFGTADANPGGYDDVVVYALGTNGVVYSDHLVKDAKTGRRVGTDFHPVYDGYDGIIVTGFSVVVTPDVAAVFTQFVPTYSYYGDNSSIRVSQATTADQPDSWKAIDVFYNGTASSIAAALGLNGVPSIYALSSASLQQSQPSGQVENGSILFSDFRTLDSHPSYSLTTAVGVSGRPVVFALGGDGSVYVDQDVSAGVVGGNDVYSGFERLAGIVATSIAATAEPGGIAVFALTGSRTFIYENQYRPTGQAVEPHAWTGWTPVGDFTASKIAAVLPGVPQDPNNPGTPASPILLALGATGLLYTLTSTAPATSSDPFTFGSPEPMADLLPFTFTARATATGAEVFGQLGPEADAYANLYLPSGTWQAEMQGWTGWQSLGDYVVGQIQAITGSGGVPALFAIDGADRQVMDEYRTPGGEADWSGFQVVEHNYATQSVATTYPANLGGVIVSVDTSDYLTLDQYLPNSSATPPFETWQPGGDLGTVFGQVVSIATTPDFVTPAVYASETDGYVYVNQAIATGHLDDPYNWATFVSLGPIPT